MISLWRFKLVLKINNIKLTMERRELHLPALLVEVAAFGMPIRATPSLALQLFGNLTLGLLPACP